MTFYYQNRQEFVKVNMGPEESGFPFENNWVAFLSIA